jgi:hypothetical protein
MNIREVKNQAPQGDCLFRKVKSIPKSATLVPQNGPIVVAHSETGHHHAIDAAHGISLFQDPKDPLVCYLQLADNVEHADVVHHRAWDTHDTVRLLGTPKKETIWEVRRQREYTPEGWRRVMD